jgi:hypothetical protein
VYRAGNVDAARSKMGRAACLSVLDTTAQWRI